jgi:methylthioribose-1-phosphate isomerase
VTQPPETGRRGFFRSLANDVVQTAGAALETVSTLNRAAADAAGAILRPAPAGMAADEAASAGEPAGPAVAADAMTGTDAASAAENSPAAGGAPSAPAEPGSPFRVAGDVIYVLDETRLPDERVEVACRSPIDLAREIARLALPGGSVPGTAAAMSLAIAAGEMREYQPAIRTAILQIRAAGLVNARSSSQHLRCAVDRVMAIHEATVNAGADGRRIADAMRQEAEAIADEALESTRRIGEQLAGSLLAAHARPVAILTHGMTDPYLAAARVTRDLQVHVTEGRPSLRSARVATVRLADAGIAHVLIADAAAGWLLSTGRVDVVVVGSERIAANGDTSNDVGSYTLAVLAARHGVPFVVVAQRGSVDLAAPTGGNVALDDRGAAELLAVGGSRLAPDGTPVLNPACDVIPHELIGAIVTEDGVLRHPYGPALARG